MANKIFGFSWPVHSGNEFRGWFLGSAFIRECFCLIVFRLSAIPFSRLGFGLANGIPRLWELTSGWDGRFCLVHVSGGIPPFGLVAHRGRVNEGCERKIVLNHRSVQLSAWAKSLRRSESSARGPSTASKARDFEHPSTCSLVFVFFFLPCGQGFIAIGLDLEI